MRIRTLALIALLTPAPLFAQTAVPPCWPFPAGTGSRVYTAVNTQGFAYGWRCPSPRTRHVVRGLWSELPADWGVRLSALMNGTDAERIAAWTQFVGGALPGYEALQPVVDDVVRQINRQPQAPVLR